ncbi:MAG: hypothetical protein ACREQO_01985 [Candidatus Binatia bacterium]
MQKIDDILREAEAHMDAMGAQPFVDQLYSGTRTEQLTRLKENWELGSFVQRYNKMYSPALVWAYHNQRKTGHADFSIYAADKSYLWDIEVTALFPKPTTKNPKSYDDFSAYPIWRDPSDSSLLHVNMNRPRKSQPYALLKDVVKKHLRDQYPPYWLVIYDNEHDVERRNLEHPANLIETILRAKAQAGQLPPGLKQAWIFDFSGAIRAWP